MNDQIKRSDLQLIYSAKEEKHQFVHFLLIFTGILFYLTLGLVLQEFYLFLLSAIALATLHRETVHSDGTAISGSIIVICAAIIGWSESAIYLPIVCAIFSGLHWDHIKNHQIKKLFVNTGATLFSTFFAILISEIFIITNSIIAICLALLGTVVTYWCVNNLIVSIAISLSSHTKFFKTFGNLVRSDLSMLWFGFAGALCGLVMLEVSPAVGILALVAVLSILDVFVISVPVGLAALRQNWLLLSVRIAATITAFSVGVVVTHAIGISVLGISIGLLAASLVALVVVTLAITVRLRYSRQSPRHLDPTLISGIVLVEVGVPLLGGLLGVVSVIASIGAAIVVAAVAAIMISLVVVGLRRRSQPEPTDGEEILGAVMLAMFDGLPDLSQHR